MSEANVRDPIDRLPLKDLEFQILLALAEGERHGWSIVRELQERRGSGKRILPGTFYRVLGGLVSDGLIERAGQSPRDDDQRRKNFKLTPQGIAVCRAEIDRLEHLVNKSRSLEVLFPVSLGPVEGGEI